MPVKTNKHLTSLSLRMASLLLEYLSMFQYRKLPQRKALSFKLNVSQQSIIDSLIELENVGFIIRRTNELEHIVYADEEEGKNIRTECEKIKAKERKARRFSDEFIINYNYNMTKGEIEKDVIRTIENALITKGLEHDDIVNIVEKLSK
ncbi:hypothetical protein AGR56_13920 [Clostridium sp. DMHC 10]|uniref:hypothetical protein n=1 Tax=Clostridium sp. DMHC 10 TaxID=747377 RepID=UPI0006A0011F|nr:hypothetical protein [Clostridium sp. DMHC 10]KOF57473.1 hypothetical protein AGR56_13920 [Clostridium sp. DMHC 10]